MRPTLRLIDPRWLARRRLKAGLTQAALAKAAKVSTSMIQKLEAGVRGASPAVAKRIATRLGCDIDDLFEVVEERRAS